MHNSYAWAFSDVLILQSCLFIWGKIKVAMSIRRFTRPSEVVTLYAQQVEMSCSLKTDCLLFR